jgi:hypothetical protein
MDNKEEQYSTGWIDCSDLPMAPKEFMDEMERMKLDQEEYLERICHNSLVMAVICFTIAAACAFIFFLPSNNSQIPTKRTGDYTDGR